MSGPKPQDIRDDVVSDPPKAVEKAAAELMPELVEEKKVEQLEQSSGPDLTWSAGETWSADQHGEEWSSSGHQGEKGSPGGEDQWGLARPNQNLEPRV